MHGISIPAEAVKLRAEAETVIAEAKQLVIDNDAGFLVAGERLKTSRSMANKIKATFDPLIQAAHRHHKSIITTRDEFLLPVEAVETVLKKKIGEYQFKLDAQRRVEESKRREEAIKRAEEEKLAMAIKAEQSGNVAQANKILEAPVIAPVVAMPEQPKVSGLSMRENWKFEIIDPSELPREYLIADEKKIGGIVRAMKGSTNIPGVRVWPEVNPVMTGVAG